MFTVRTLLLDLHTILLSLQALNFPWQDINTSSNVLEHKRPEVLEYREITMFSKLDIKNAVRYSPVLLQLLHKQRRTWRKQDTNFFIKIYEFYQTQKVF